MWCLSCHYPPLCLREELIVKKKNYRSEHIYIATHVLDTDVLMLLWGTLLYFCFGIWELSFATLAEGLGKTLRMFGICVPLATINF